jgi:inosine-uridine nucleoside N-ribohydrolase
MPADLGTSEPAARARVHLDTDFAGDIDDLCALALLLSHPNIEVSGVTTVLEHGGQRAGYARYALALASRGEVPVAAGADVSVGRFRESEYGLPSPERYWPAPVAAAPGDLEAALALLERSIEAGATVVAIGPPTNLALLEERRPGILRRARLVVMGGSIDPAPPGFPQWTFEMDFNLQTDAVAAARVLEAANPEQTTLVPIEVTAQTALRTADLPALRRGGALAVLVARQAEAFALDEDYAERYGRPCAGLPDDVVNFQHDPLACAVALGWPGATIETVPLALSLEGGWLRLRRDPRGRPFRVATAVDGPAFGAFWLDAVTRGAG